LGHKPKGADPRWTLAASILASSLSFVDGSVLNVALPAIRSSYRAQAADIQWVVNAYLLPLSALLLLGGALGDHFGRRRLLIVGTALFAAFVWYLFGRLRAGRAVGRGLQALRDPLAARVRPVAWGLTAALV
jgi:MFS family permease